MSTQSDARRKRKSLGAVTSSKPMEKDNLRRKGARSKSIGPGGLDALQQTSGNRRASSISKFQPRSILKSSAPHTDGNETENLIDLGHRDNMTVSGNESATNPDGSKIALRTEEEQQKAAREREERERKEARRKSLGANRRVSFAAEATLYTFHEVEYVQDSTSSTEASRRASSGRQQPPPARNEANGSGQAHGQQSRRRRSSVQSTADLDNRDDHTFTSSAYSSDSEADAVEEVEDHEDSGSSSDSGDSDDGTMMTIDGEEMTSGSMASGADDSTLDDALRLAAQHAGTQQLETDDGVDEEEEVIPSFGWIKKGPAQAAPPPQPPTLQPPSHNAEPEDTMDLDTDMDMTSAAGRIIQPSQQAESDEGGDMSMDVTKAFGTIMGQNQREATTAMGGSSREKPDDVTGEDATMDLTVADGGVRHPPAEDETFHDDEEMSMELTTVVGGVIGIKHPGRSRRQTINQADQTVNVEQDMDLTVGAGRILSSQPARGGNESGSDGDATMDMDVTVAEGKVLPPAALAQAIEPANDDEATMAMDMTAAVGNILKPQPESRSEAKSMMKAEVNKPDSPSKPRSISPSLETPQTASAEPSTNEADSPGLSAFRGKGLRRSLPSAAAEPLLDTPQTPAEPASPSKKRGSTPRRTPSPSKSSSPRKRSSPAKSSTSKKAVSPAKSPTPKQTAPSKSPQRKTPDSKSSERNSSEQGSPKNGSLWVDNPKTGSKTPTVILTPQQRKLSGLGLDREGLGSPRVSALLDRRTSIGDSSETFSPSKSNNKCKVTFEDPRVIEEAVDKERRDEEEDEDRRKRANGGQDEHELTLNLKEMIASLSPKKNPLRGRKSLHVGSARGILGKRPAELDEESDGEERDGVKRLKNHQSSPVKNVRLQQPPSIAETTTGRLTRSRESPEQDKENVSPPLNNENSEDRGTPAEGQDHERNAGDDTLSRTVNSGEPRIHGDETRGGDNTDGRIHLQDFLNMISVRFMDLTTSKRRQTQMPAALPEGEDDMSLERCVVAGACTVPMLELYQHSCRELKKYISEGRRIVKEIESETFEDNPPLFREYMSATPDFKMLMDSQFKNVKTHARLLSKAMWYEWRMKLQDGLKEGLVQISQEMDEDDESLKRQRELLDSVLPGVLSRYDSLSKEHANLEMYAKELGECDPDELQGARDELVGVEGDIEAKKKAIAELRSELQETESELEQVSAKKQECLEDIKEAEKIREECRGWSTTEINLHKARVEALEKERGWSVTGASGTQLSLAYKRAIEVVFDVASFRRNQPSSRIDVRHIATNHDSSTQPATPEREFFLHLIRDCVRALPQGRVRVHEMLSMVQAAWDTAERVAKDVRVVNVTFPTKVVRTGDSSIAVVSSVMVVPLGTRIEVSVNVRGVAGMKGVEVAVEPEAKLCYGENFNVEKINEFLAERIGRPGEVSESWSDVLVSLHERLLARGKKGVSG